MLPEGARCRGDGARRRGEGCRRGSSLTRSGWAFVDGRGVPLEDAAFPVTDPAVAVGYSVFETVRSDAEGKVRRIEQHLARLERSCKATSIPMPPPDVLAEEMRRAAARVGVAARVRVTLSGSGRRIVYAKPLDPERLHRPVRGVRGRYRAEPYLGGAVKHGSRAPWVAAVARSGVDEVLMVDSDGRFTEGTSSAILAVIDGALWTAPHDGRILESTTCIEILERAEAAGIPVVRRGAPASGPWAGLYIASTTRDLAPVAELDGESLSGWEPVGQLLREPQG